MADISYPSDATVRTAVTLESLDMAFCGYAGSSSALATSYSTIKDALDGFLAVPWDNVIMAPHITDATKITLASGGQYVTPDATLNTLSSTATLDIDTDLTTDDTLTPETLYYIWGNGSVWKFSDDATSAPSDVSGGMRLKYPIYVMSNSEILPFWMTNDAMRVKRSQLQHPWVDTAATLPGNLGDSQYAIIGATMYLFGGGAVGTDVIYSAPVSTPTSWSDTTATLPAVLGNSQLAIIGSTIYLFGGASSDVIYSASVSTPTSWSDTTATLPAALGSSQLAIIGSTIYLFGGDSSNVIYSAPVSTPTVWTDTTATLPGALGSSQLAIIGNRIFLFGGESSDVIYSAPTSDPTNWSDTTATLPTNLGNSQLAIIGNRIFLIGGNISGATDVIYSAPVNDPTNWSDTTATLPGAAQNTKVAVIDDTIYLFGGTASDVIYSAPLAEFYGQTLVDANDEIWLEKGGGILIASAHELHENRPWRMA